MTAEHDKTGMNMTTTAFDDQFTVAPAELVRHPYDTVAVLRRNVAALEVALRTQTERAIQAERDFESLISDDNTIQEYAYELGGTDSGEYHLTAQDVARIAAKASEPYTSALRSLASYVGAGGYNADAVDAGVFEDKIRWGIGEIQDRLAGAIERELVARTSLIEARNDIQAWIDSRNEWMKRAEAAEAELLAIREDNHSMMLEIHSLRIERAAPDCQTCANRGQVSGLSQESYCDGCVYQGRSWRKNHFVLAVKRRCEACAVLPCSCK